MIQRRRGFLCLSSPSTCRPTLRAFAEDMRAYFKKTNGIKRELTTSVR
jgi:hypothetical protein